VQFIANLSKRFGRDRVIACNSMENLKQLFADCADATQRCSLCRPAGLDRSPVRQLSLASPSVHILGSLKMFLLLSRIRSKCDGIDEIESEVPGDKLKSVILTVHDGRPI
jgi:hypothetical protein